MSKVKSYHGVAINSGGKHKTWAGSKEGGPTLAFRKWRNMLQRCYCPNYLARKPEYIGCSVSPEWLDFQGFAEWFEQQDLYAEDLQLDKDILVKGNRVYGPETCCLVPRAINLLMTSTKKNRGDLPVGVRRSLKRFRACIRIRGRKIGLGTFATPEEAFYAYKSAKEAHIRDLVGNDYKDILPENIKEALLRIRIEITD